MPSASGRATKRHKGGCRGRHGRMAQEARQERGPAQRDGEGAAVPRQAQRLDDPDGPPLIDPELIEDYLSVPLTPTIHSILCWNDPRYDMRGIREGIEHGGYRKALERLLPNPPPRSIHGTRLGDNRARMLERLGRYEEAEALYRDLVDEEPGQSSSHLDMARVLDHMGRRKESAEELARACKLDPQCSQAFESGMRPDPRQEDPSAVPLRLIIPMSVISAAETVRSRAELGAASLRVQSECGMDMYAPSEARLPGCAGLGADMGTFHHLVVEDILPYCAVDEQPYYYDLTDRGIEMIGQLGERLGGNGDIAARIAESAQRVARIGPHAVLEEACGMARARARVARAATLAGLRGTAERIRREIGNGIAFGEPHAIPLESNAEVVPEILSQARDAPDEQWAVVAALSGDILNLCARVAFDQRPRPRTAAVGPPYPDIKDMYTLLCRYCRAKGIANAMDRPSTLRMMTAKDAEEISRDMLKVISES